VKVNPSGSPTISSKMASCQCRWHAHASTRETHPRSASGEIVSALRDESGKVSSSRVAGFVLVALLVAVIVSNVWFDKSVADKVYDTLETLILGLVLGVSARAGMKLFKGGE